MQQENAGLEVVNICRKGGCCPFMEFHEDGSVSFSEDGRELIRLPKELADAAARALSDRGYGR